jgi:hypothetical protein
MSFNSKQIDLRKVIQPAGIAGYHLSIYPIRVQILLLCLLFLSTAVFSSTKVLFLPFEDKVKLNEAWDLSIDIPRWYSQTVDTISARDTLVKTISFDTVQSLIKRNGWKRADYMTVSTIQRIAAVCEADIVVTGTIYTFKVMKRSANADGSLTSQTSFTPTVMGQGGATAMVGLQDFSAESKMDIVFYNGRDGKPFEKIVLDSKRNDGGIKIWLPIQTENDEMNFYHLSRSPFGSEYFNKNIVGAVMKSFSQKIRETIRSREPPAIHPADTAREFLEGKILEKIGQDVYVNLGSKDNLILGDILEVLKPVKPILNGTDTLGWAEQPAGVIKIRSIKSNHFSQATISGDTGSIQAGWTVRMKMGPGKQ